VCAFDAQEISGPWVAFFAFLAACCWGVFGAPSLLVCTRTFVRGRRMAYRSFERDVVRAHETGEKQLFALGIVDLAEVQVLGHIDAVRRSSRAAWKRGSVWAFGTDRRVHDIAGWQPARSRAGPRSRLTLLPTAPRSRGWRTATYTDVTAGCDRQPTS